MAIPDTLITINGVTLTKSDISSFKLTYNKLWKDADRNMNGDVSAAFIGVFPNFDITTGILSIAKIQSLAAAINTPYFSVTFYDTQTQTNKTANYYAADFETTLNGACTYGTIQVQLVAVSKANYI